MRTILTVTTLGLALLTAVPQASAFGMRGGPGFFGARGGPHGGPGGGGPGGMPLRLLIAQLNPDQRAQVRQILIADRGTMRDTARQLRAAHEALADKLFAGGTLAQADVAPDVQKIAALHQQLVEHGTSVMLQVRAIATPEQLAKAAAAKQKLDELHGEIRALFGKPSPEGDDDLPD